MVLAIRLYFYPWRCFSHRVDIPHWSQCAKNPPSNRQFLPCTADPTGPWWSLERSCKTRPEEYLLIVRRIQSRKEGRLESQNCTPTTVPWIQMDPWHGANDYTWFYADTHVSLYFKRVVLHPKRWNTHSSCTSCPCSAVSDITSGDEWYQCVGLIYRVIFVSILK
jgi:hypothetical protein